MVHKQKLSQSEKELYRQVKELMRVNALPKDVLIESRRLIASGGINTLGVKPTEYLRAKVVLATAFKNIADDLEPLTDEGRDMKKNLEKF